MTKRDREKMVGRMFRRLQKLGLANAPVAWFVADEVDRAVRIERKAWHDAEELRLALMQRTAEQISERANKGKSR